MLKEAALKLEIYQGELEEVEQWGPWTGFLILTCEVVNENVLGNR